MKLNLYMASRLREVLLDGKWIANTNLKSQIESTTWQQSITKKGNHNTIALLTFHITYYIKGLNQVMENGVLDIKDKSSFDMPELKDEGDWNNLVQDFISSSKIFIKHIEEMEEAKLTQSFVREEYGTYLRNIEAIIEHTYYHLGQISLIKKLI